MRTRTLALVLLFVAASVAFHGYWVYSQRSHAGTWRHENVVAERALAPWQYRIAIPLAAEWLHRHTPLGLRHAYGGIDFVALVVALLGLGAIFLRDLARDARPRLERLALSLLFVAVTQYYLLWHLWYQQPYTLPSLAYLVVSVLLLRRGGALAAAALIVLSVGQSFNRPDIVVALHAGFAAHHLFVRRRVLATSLAAVGIALAIQYYLSAVRYPDAAFDLSQFQLLENLDPRRLSVFLLFIPPYALTLWAIRGRLRSGGGLLWASLVYLGMWATLGRIHEVRIFLPFAVALAPLTARACLERLAPVAEVSA